MYFVYMIECGDGSLYTGITTNVVRRFNEHKNKLGGHYTKAKGVVRVVYTEESHNRSSASKRESEIKKLPRQKKMKMVELSDIYNHLQ